jgi:ADP-ribose pyrophosphatase
MSNALKQKSLEETAKVESQEIFTGKIFTLKRDTLYFEEGETHAWDLILHPGAVAMLPINQAGNLLLIRQWRRAIGQIIYEIPAGTLDEGEDPLACVQRELQEEIGQKAECFIPLGGLYTAPGYCNEYVHLFIAQGLTESSLPQDAHEGIDVVEISLKEALAKIDAGQIQDGKTLCALLRYQRWLADA